MKKFFSPIFIEIIICAVILILGIGLESKILISGDITWLMHVGGKFLAGGRYYTDFFEVNPPMCIYIYLLPVLASKLFHISYTTSVTIYTYLIAIPSWLFCRHLLITILKNQSLFYRVNFTIMLAFIYFLLPMNGFGQREYLFVVLTIPYILITVMRAKQLPVITGLALFAGLLAGIGIAQKPFFVPTWILIELYLITKFRNLFYSLRWENFAIVIILLAYTISVLVLVPEYLSKILPLVKIFYYNNYYFPLYILLFRPIVIYSAFLFLIYCFFRRYCQQKELVDILQFANLGCFILYLAQNTFWFYHVLPLVMLTALLAVTLMNECWQKYNLFQHHYLDFNLLKSVTLNSFFTLLVLFPFVGATYGITLALKQANTFFNKPIFKFIQQAPQRNVFIFTEDITTNYPFLDYTGAQSPSRFPCLWLITATDRILEKGTHTGTTNIAKRTKNFVIEATINDLNAHKPNYILIEKFDTYYFVHKVNSIVYSMQIFKDHPAVNHFDAFTQNVQFKQLWKHYCLIGQINNFAVYQKID